MNTRQLGQSGLAVSAIGLGCMGMSEFYGPRDERESLATLDRAFDLDITFFDTADMYGPYTNEQLVGHGPDPGIARADAGLDEGLALPELGAVGEVCAVAVQREDEGAHPALGPQPQIHPEGMSLVGHRLEGLDDAFHRLGEEVAVGHATGLATRGPAVLAVDEDQVDVR